MFENLSVFEQRCQDIDERICDPAVIADRKQYAELQRERKNLMPIVEKYREYTETQAQLDEAKSLLQEGGLDRELRELAEEQLSEARDALETITEELKILLLPKDPNDDRNVIMEIRAGAGGEEAALFASVLFRMYAMYAELKGWKTEFLSANETELGGYKEISFAINGEGAYSRLKYESGVHRVQRVRS